MLAHVKSSAQITSADTSFSFGTPESRQPPIFSVSTSKNSTPASAMSDDDIIEISKTTFDNTVSKKRKLNPPETTAKIIKGSSYGGRDPLHQLLQESGVEPIHWREERERKAAEVKRLQRKKNVFIKPKKSKQVKQGTPPGEYLRADRYERLPYSPQEILTSGLNLYWDPEGDSEVFWGRVSRGWEKSVRRESVEARRRRFNNGFSPMKL